jgi:carbon-monoxide dehydrogenase catalytic subunit
VASGVLIIFGRELLPVSGSENVSNYLFGGIEKDFGGRWAVESDPFKAAEIMLAHIEGKRDALGINKVRERKLYDMADRRALTVE